MDRSRVRIRIKDRGSNIRIKDQDGLNGQYSHKTCAFFVFSEAMGCGWFGSHCWSPAISAGPKLGLHSVHCSTLCAQCLLLVLSLLCIVSTAHSWLVLSLHCPTHCWYNLYTVPTVHTAGTISAGPKLAHSWTNYLLLLPFLLKLPIFHYVDDKTYLKTKPARRLSIIDLHISPLI